MQVEDSRSILQAPSFFSFPRLSLTTSPCLKLKIKYKDSYFLVRSLGVKPNKYQCSVGNFQTISMIQGLGTAKNGGSSLTLFVLLESNQQDQSLILRCYHYTKNEVAQNFKHQNESELLSSYSTNRLRFQHLWDVLNTIKFGFGCSNFFWHRGCFRVIFLDTSKIFRKYRQQ